VGVGRLANAVSSSSDGPYLLRLLRYPWKIHHIMEADHVILRESRLIICPSEAMKDLLVRNGGPEDRIVLLSHGIDVLPKTPLAPFDGRSLRFGYVGRVDRLKGLHVLVEAVQMLRPSGRVELHVYGAASSPVGQDYLENLLSAHGGQENICLHGSLQYEKMAEAFANIDVLVVPSIAPEAFGLVVVEAFSAGRPVIVFDSGALGELVRNGVDGFVVERNDPQALAEAMQRFIDDPGLVVKMAANIGPVKTMSQYVDELEVVYDRAISGYSPGVQKGNCW